jgi:predicted RNA-binding protein with PIN domain
MHWLIDGHNLIGQMPNLHLSDPNDEEILLEYLRRYRARTGHQLTVVFDAGQSYRPATKKKQSGITVQFAPHGQTADRLITERVRRIKNPQAMIVVTSDRAVQQAAQQMGVRVVTAQEFSRQLLNLSTAAKPSDEDVQANRQLSADEVEEWLSIFEQGKDESDNPAHCP